jgi:hypothetical protein
VSRWGEPLGCGLPPLDAMMRSHEHVVDCEPRTGARSVLNATASARVARTDGLEIRRRGVLLLEMVWVLALYVHDSWEERSAGFNYVAGMPGGASQWKMSSPSWKVPKVGDKCVRVRPMWFMGVASAASPTPSLAATADVVVYGSSGAGCIAAIAATRAGLTSVMMLSQTAHIGGMLTGGLMHTDSANASVVQGITREFFVRTEEQYPGRPTNASFPPGHSPPGWLFESHVAERVLNIMLSEANVSVVRSVGGVIGVSRTGTRLTSVTTEDGATRRAAVFIDASYEGDIVAKVASMTWGREASAQYGEVGAGRQPGASIGARVSPYWDPHALPFDTPSNILPHVASEVPVAVGEADRWMEPMTSGCA